MVYLVRNQFQLNVDYLLNLIERSTPCGLVLQDTLIILSYRLTQLIELVVNVGIS